MNWIVVNVIGLEGAKAIAEALKVNQTITNINLSWNNIGDEGAKAIAEALKVNQTITEIDVKYNEIGGEGAQAMAEAMKQNKSVTKFEGIENKRYSAEIEAYCEVNKNRLKKCLACDQEIDSETKITAFTLSSYDSLVLVCNQCGNESKNSPALKATNEIHNQNVESSSPPPHDLEDHA